MQVLLISTVQCVLNDSCDLVQYSELQILSEPLSSCFICVTAALLSDNCFDVPRFFGGDPCTYSLNSVRVPQACGPSF